MSLQQQSPLSTMKDWALFYASKNLPVIPLFNPINQERCTCNNLQCKNIGKHPRVKNGLHDATTNPTTIEQWWNQWPDSNIGIQTGQKSGIFVIDIDPRHGGIDSLEKLDGNLDGVQVTTGGDGKHFYFEYPQKEHIVKNMVNLLPGIDVRGQGGYIVAPPSKHAMGKNYIWNHSPEAFPKAPDWLINRVSNHIHKDTHKETRPPQNETVAPANTSSVVIPEGRRNQFLLSMGGLLRRHGLNETQIETELTKINESVCSPSLQSYEVSSISKGLAKYPATHTNNEVSHLWSELKSLPDFSLSAPALDESSIPNNIKDWVIDIAKRMQVPLEFIAAPAIVGMSSLIGRKIKVFPKKNDNWQVIPNLWGGIIARPGTFKSPAISEAMRPVEKLVKKENEIYEQKKAAWEIEKEINFATITAVKEQLIKSIKKNQLKEVDDLKKKLVELSSKDKNLAPTCKRYKTNDATIEKLSQLILENPTGLLLLRDELAGWLCTLQKYGREGDREFYLESWNGYGSYTVDRIGRGTVHIPALCLSIFGGIQPDKLQKYLTANLEGNDDGLLQRFQVLIYPEIKDEWKNIDLIPDENAINNVYEIFQKIDQIVDDNNALHFDHEAQVIFDNWREDLENTLRSGTIKNESFESHLAKFRSLMPSLALVFYVLKKKGDINFTNDTGIDKDSALLAIKWCDYLKIHAQKVYQIHGDQLRLTVKALVEKIKSGQIGDGDQLRSIQRHGWPHLKTAKDIKEGILFLAQYGWARLENASKGNKESLMIRLNPAL